MSRFVVIIVLAGMAVAGLLRLAARLLAWKRKKRFAKTYLAQFRLLANSEAFDEEVYAWLVARSTRMQERLGSLGVIGYAATPYDPTPLGADPLIINTLPELRNGWVRPERKDQCEDAMMRYLGMLDEERAGYTKQFVNPMIWLGEGVRAVLLLPFWTLRWLGLFKETSVIRWAQSTLFSLLSGLVAVLGLAAFVMIVVFGWEHFTALLTQWTTTVFSYVA